MPLGTHWLPIGVLLLACLCSCSKNAKKRSRHSAHSQPTGARSASASLPSAAHELRPILPQAGSVQLSAQIQFRWRGAGSKVLYARKRNFSAGHEEFVGAPLDGDPELLSATSRPLDEGIWFWRVGSPEGMSDAVWSFRVHRVKGVSNAGSVRDGWDFNCDGRADIPLVGEVALGGDPPVVISCQLGELAIKALEPVPGYPGPKWDRLIAIGDVDGDGCDDAIAPVTRVSPDMYVNPRPAVPILFRGQPGLTTTWSAAGQSAHLVNPVGDITLDGYADGAECDTHGCNVYLGGRAGLQEQPYRTFKDSDALLAGDFDADGLPDLWSVNQEGNSGARVSFFSGKTSFSATPAGSFSLPDKLNGNPTTGLIDRGASALLGFVGTERTDSFWRVAHSAAKATVERWPEAAHATSTWAPQWGIGSWAFIPFVGPGRRGILVVVPLRRNDFAPVQSFLQYGVSPEGTPFLLGRLTLTELEPIEPIVGLEPVGDMNGDGYDELLVRASDDNMGTPLWYEYRGSATGFKFERRLW